MNLAPPADDEIAHCLEAGGNVGRGGPAVVAIERVAYPYATSFPLEEVTVRLDDGSGLQLILKDLTWERLLGDARRTKPAFLYDPRRCIETYRRILPGRGVGPACYGAVTDDERERYWLLIEKVPGVELWQVGEVGVWEEVARWLARFHRSFAGEGEGVTRRNPHLLRYDADFLRIWPARALDVVTRQDPGGDTVARMSDLVAGYGRVVDVLTSLPPSFIHGELYPSNVLVGTAGEGTAVWPVDWEMAGVGPPLLDLAALTAGWQGQEQTRLVDAYVHELRLVGGIEGPGQAPAVLDACRLHYALQWLGWSRDWVAPPEHARDWVSEALALGQRLGL